MNVIVIDIAQFTWYFCSTYSLTLVRYSQEKERANVLVPFPGTRESDLSKHLEDLVEALGHHLSHHLSLAPVKSVLGKHLKDHA